MDFIRTILDVFFDEPCALINTDGSSLMDPDPPWLKPRLFCSVNRATSNLASDHAEESSDSHITTTAHMTSYGFIHSKIPRMEC